MTQPAVAQFTPPSTDSSVARRRVSDDDLLLLSEICGTRGKSSQAPKKPAERTKYLNGCRRQFQKRFALSNQDFAQLLATYRGVNGPIKVRQQLEQRQRQEGQTELVS
jgi:hypothetical protein